MESTEACFSVKAQSKEKTNGLRVITSEGRIENRPSSNKFFLAMRDGQEDDNRPEQGSSTANEFNSEGNINLTRLEVNEDEVFYSNPEVDSVPLKRISRKNSRRKPKRKEDFRVGKISKWNEFYTGRGKRKGKDEISRDEGDVCLKNKKFDWKVYTRRNKSKSKGPAKGKGEIGPLENFIHDNWQGLEEQFIDSCQTTYTSSENYESDKEVFEIEEVDFEKDRELGEEEGYERLRLLLGEKTTEVNVQSTSNGELVDKLNVLGNPVQLTENRDIRQMGLKELERDVQPIYEGDMVDKTKGSVQGVQIGKVGVIWEEIRSVGKLLNLELIDKEAIEVSNLVEDKGERSIARRKGIERELHNLNFNINYEKGKAKMGLSSDT